jgi:hypothetical protein
MKGFWTNKGIIPRRKNKFLVQLEFSEGFAGIAWWAKDIDLPSMSIEAEAIRNNIGANRVYKFPRRVEWKPITMTLVDPVGEFDIKKSMDSEGKTTETLVDGDTLNVVHQMVQSLTEAFDDDERIYKGARNASKQRMNNTFKSVIITSYLGVGGETINAIDQWNLKNIILTEFDLGNLSYEDDGLSEIKLTFDYEWAEYTARPNGFPDTHFSRGKEP